ncbi:39S ribosomal protein L38, mitochondrial [Culex pipiens pallens]|uniref:39S ribosomal protein L38, mitochondrial n=1 Tax=Culex pipiens pallens TaxID=42434 RepID=UPI0019537907|nr:39S ribosomal protein L38, mitochondrial [Culex pipiens pallens]
MAARIGVQSLLSGPQLLATSLATTRLQVRHGHRLRGKAPGVAKTLEQRLAEERAVDPEVARKVNIGFPHLKPARSAQLKERLDHLKAQRSNPELEKLARAKTLTVDPELVRRDWLKTSGPFHVQRLAEHYGVFEHLFGAAYFVPRVNLKVAFPTSGGELASPVYYGNVIKPSEATSEPDVQFDPNFDFKGSESKQVGGDSWWTLVLTNPDGHFTESDKEYCHWFVANIPNGDVAKGERIVPYLQPIPPKGTGFHRHVFVLYKQEKKLDFGEYAVGEQDRTDLAKRTFQTVEFYRRFQDEITPAGLAFFQADWDQSLVGFYHDVLKRKHPVYEYDFPAPYLRDQEWFPLRRPFNLYMDKYRDPKQVAKEYLARKLARTHPFEGPEPALRFPNAHPVPREVPSWLTTQIKKDRRGWGRVNDV